MAIHKSFVLLPSCVLLWLTLIKKKIKGLPDQGAREHIHLNPGTHLGNNSIRLVLGRAEDKTGELNPDYEPRTSKSANVGF